MHSGMILTHSMPLQGCLYRPNVVRVGSEEAPLAERARDVWVDGLIRRYLDMEQGEWGYRYQVPLWH